MNEPHIKRVYAFIDGQNLFRCAKNCYGYHFPNFDPIRLAKAVCNNKDIAWRLDKVLFYTGIPSAKHSPLWNHFWNAKLSALGRNPKFKACTREVRYRTTSFECPDRCNSCNCHNNGHFQFTIGAEKGIDVRLALDTVSLARQNAYDVALVFSQDQDLAEVAEEIRAISREHNRWIHIASAFPVAPKQNTRGIQKTDWTPFDKVLYDSCIDPKDYRPKRKK